MSNFKEKPIALKKSELTSQENDLIFNEQWYKNIVQKNRASLKEILQNKKDDIDENFLEYIHQHTRMNGAVNLREILQNPFHTSFLDNPDRLSRSGMYSRGYTYIVSLDKGLTATEKISILKKDLFDALDGIHKTQSTFEKFVLSDYVKNAVMTMVNALLSQEKIGEFALKNEEYQHVRTELIDLASLATEFHYQFFFKERLCSFPDNYRTRVENAMIYLERKAGIRYSRLHGALLSRPEVSHPLVIFYSSLNIASAHPDIQTIIGLPSGGTELALLTQVQYEFLYGATLPKILLPISLHSAKDVFGTQKVKEEERRSFLEKNRMNLSQKNILICDDNSSTGKTLQLTQDILEPLVGDRKIVIAVAEIDSRRSILDRENAKRTHVANPKLFEQSINILPVSKIIKPKTDIKELMDKQEIIDHHKRCITEAYNDIEKIYHEVMLDTVEHETAEIMDQTSKDLIIGNFHGTFLSNFYAVPVTYRGISYPSTEHAYQYQKFSEEVLRVVDENTLEEIREKMRIRGYAAQIDDVSLLFTDNTFSSGNIKIIADILRNHGYGKENWAEERVRTMIELLLLKFSDVEMRRRLGETDGKLLVEGNDWQDTLWGFCEGKGRNLLGRVLMNIREKQKASLL